MSTTGIQPELILHNGHLTTLDPSNPSATAVAIADGRFMALGSDADVMPLARNATKVVDLGGRPVLTGLIDNDLHLIRGGLNYNMELRWDGVRSLAAAMEMFKQQVAITPAPQLVRVVGGFTEHRVEEMRLPTIEELKATLNKYLIFADGHVTTGRRGERKGLNQRYLNAVALDTPAFILHLYDRALLNAAALRVVGYTKDTLEPPGGKILRDDAGNPTGVILANPNAAILYATLAKGPKLQPEYQYNSTRHFTRELSRLGVTGAIDAGQLTIRIAYNLFTQKPKAEKEDFVKVSAGTDATCVASYNPWVSLAWSVSGKTVAGLSMYLQRNLLDRETALLMWTAYVTWFSNEEGRKGRSAVGQLADLTVPDSDFFECAEDDIAATTALLTVVGGRIVWGAGPFSQYDAPIPPAMPDWSPVRQYGGYSRWGATKREGAPLKRAAAAAMCGCASACNVHGHAHTSAWGNALHAADAKAFWGAFGCSCWGI